MRNPLIKRIPKELASDWHKYLVIIIFMVVMIGLISGMYVGHDSMLEAVYSGRDELNLEDGSFELSGKASEELLADLSTGQMADVRQFFIDKGIEEADEEVAEAIEEELQNQVAQGIEDMVRAQCEAYGITDETMIQEQIDTAMDENYEEALAEARESDEFIEAVDEAYEEAHNTVIEKVDEKWDEIVEEYGLDDEDFEATPITIYEHFYRNESEDNNNDGTNDATLRIFPSNYTVDMASFNEGRAPETTAEIAIDRMHADNVGVGIGDTITVGGKQFEIVGLLSYVNYLTLHESNTDLMFDAFGFDVGMVTPEAFDSFSSRVHYSYAWFYETEPEDKIEAADLGNNVLKSLITQSLVYETDIDDFLPEYARQASNFAPNDIEHDTTGTSILCYILIAVIAFIFAVTISNTIEKEASVIGTLRASGYTKDELIIHYMTMPIIVTFLGAIIGNVVGYTAFRKLAIYLYYNSYSLPTCGITWSPIALVKTTIIPLLLMFFVNLIVIAKSLQLSPLKFLRHDLHKTKRSKARRIPGWSFLNRFRVRILFQNMPNYAILIFGVIFIELMLCFAFGLPDSLNHYADNAPGMMFSEYQYMLMGSKDDDGEFIVTDEPTAEAFSATNLMYPKDATKMFEGMGSGGDEGVTVYGITDDSRYISISNDIAEGEVYISSAFAKKFELSSGDVITLHEEYENKSYEFTIAGEVDYDGGIAVFMPNDNFNSIFEKKEGEFSGYFSENEITDIEEKYIATVITVEDITKVTNQLMHSMGGMMDTFRYALIVMAAALIYLLAKIIIERNENAISMVKILGFRNGEIAGLYMVPTAIVVVLFSVVSMFVGYYLMVWIFKVFMLQMDGWFKYYMSPSSLVLSVVYLLIGYAFVSVIDFFRIKRIPMDEALKNVD
ncbi:MAG: FtsX-like permease family protein [Clostridiales bacterium]|nr:FtsX-like permease family protein [Clostridiales bacterium]